MIGKICLMLALFSMMMPVWGQTDRGSQSSVDESPMVAPPPVSGQAFSTTPSSGERSNYLGIGLVSGAAYATNVLFGTQSSAPVNDETYTIWPTITYNHSDVRLQELLTYSPGFTFYQHVTAYNQSSENVLGQISYRTSEHSTLSAHDSFNKASNFFSTPYSLAGATVAGSPGIQTSSVIVPYANEITNTGDGEFTYQFSESGMIGASGGVSEFDFPNPSQTPGLYNSNGYMGAAFFNIRPSRRQYVGVSDGFISIAEDIKGGNIQTQTDAITPFYTLNLMDNATEHIALSALGGPEHYEASAPGTTSVSGWQPNIVGSIHIGVRKATFSVSYQYGITAGGGLAGAFKGNNGTANANFQFSRSWGFGGSGTYNDSKSIVPSSAYFGQGGHGIGAATALRHQMGQHLQAEVGYSYLHQNYAGIAIIANSPTSQRVYGTISYQLRRPLGR